MIRLPTLALLLLTLATSTGLQAQPQSRPIFARDNLVAWCIVPFDGKHRTPAERAAMLQRIGIRRFAYDWRNPHLPTFDAELDELAKCDIELTAVWFPAALTDEARVLLDGLRKHKLKTQLWVMADVNTVQAGVDAITPIAREAATLGCTVGLYNHGGWYGEPENQIAIVEQLKKNGVTNVGIVYNLHHGHTHLDRFPAVLAEMKPHLLALNLNGMVRDGESTDRKILPIGQGDLDLTLLKTIRDSGYAGPIGILNHTDEDAEGRLVDNLEGLEWLVPQLDGKPPGDAKAYATDVASPITHVFLFEARVCSRRARPEIAAGRRFAVSQTGERFDVALRFGLRNREGADSRPCETLAGLAAGAPGA